MDLELRFYEQQQWTRVLTVPNRGQVPASCFVPMMSMSYLSPSVPQGLGTSLPKPGHLDVARGYPTASDALHVSVCRLNTPFDDSSRIVVLFEIWLWSIPNRIKMLETTLIVMRRTCKKGVLEKRRNREKSY